MYIEVKGIPSRLSDAITSLLVYLNISINIGLASHLSGEIVNQRTEQDVIYPLSC